jgi:hypothetical protein
MPRGQHVAGATPRENRMYSHVLAGYRKAGRSAKWAKQMAARTVNKYRSRKAKG